MEFEKAGFIPFNFIRRDEKMKKNLVLVLALMVMVGLFPVVSSGADNLPAADGANLWKYISEDNPYQGWGFWPGRYGISPGKSPHGAYVKIYANSIALKAAREGRTMPYGSIIVKENYGKDKKTLMVVTPMYKVKGYDPEAGDWFWGKYGPNGKVMKAGKVKGCINCHRVRQSKDWIFTEPK